MPRILAPVVVAGLYATIMAAPACADAVRDPSERTILAQAPSPAAVPLVAPAGQPAPTPRFDITRYDVQGNTVLDPALVDRAIAPYVGKGKDFGDVQRALESLQIVYERMGYGTVQVTLPEQELDKGVVVLRVIETRLGKVTVEGNRFYSTDNIRRSLPALEEGKTPNSVEIGRQARVANESPTKNATVVLRASKTENEVDAVVRVQDEKPWRANVSLDNTGSKATGMYRLGFGYQFTNLFDRDHVVTVQYQMSPERLSDWEDVRVFGVGYRVPLYARGDSVEFIAGYSDVANATVPNFGSFNGSGIVMGARYNHMLPRIAGLAGYEHRLTVGFDYKAYSAVTLQGGGALTPDITVHPITFTYSGTRRFESTEMGFFVSVSNNFYPHGADAGADRFNGPNGLRPGVGSPKYTVWRYGANLAHAFSNDVQMRMLLNGQWTGDALIPGEKFGLGGVDSIRGMYERDAQNDRGLRGSVEIYTPDLGPKLGPAAGGVKLRLLAFTDWGRLKENRVTPAQCATPTFCGQSALSMGFGVRMVWPKGFAMRFDYGQLVDGAGRSDRHDDRLHFSIGATF